MISFTLDRITGEITLIPFRDNSDLSQTSLTRIEIPVDGCTKVTLRYRDTCWIIRISGYITTTSGHYTTWNSKDLEERVYLTDDEHIRRFAHQTMINLTGTSLNFNHPLLGAVTYL